MLPSFQSLQVCSCLSSCIFFQWETNVILFFLSALEFFSWFGSCEADGGIYKSPLLLFLVPLLLGSILLHVYRVTQRVQLKAGTHLLEKMLPGLSMVQMLRYCWPYTWIIFSPNIEGFTIWKEKKMVHRTYLIHCWSWRCIVLFLQFQWLIWQIAHQGSFSRGIGYPSSQVTVSFSCSLWLTI